MSCAVGSLTFNSSGSRSLGGAGVVTVYEYEQHYFGFDDVACHGPFTEFERACDKVGIYTITDATISIIIEGEETFDPDARTFIVISESLKMLHQARKSMRNQDNS